MTNAILLDSSYMVALYYSQDKYHRTSINFARQSDDITILPEVALTEIAFLLRRNGGQLALGYFLDDLQEEQTALESLTLIDIKRAREISIEYASASFDFVDCCLMALSERLDITRICTFDRRDFSIFRPKHCEYLELLP